MGFFKVQCIDCKYDEEEGMLVLDCFFFEQGAHKVVVFSKTDFHYHGYEVPDHEMYRTAKMFRGKKFTLQVDDDPNREQISEKDVMHYASMFNNSVSNALTKMTEESSCDSGQIGNRLRELADQGKLGPNRTK